ncbi:MAG: phospho-N-acetylmuramoyl-pentapeptide-transferase [Patescibacteria group bacterium]
MIQLCLGLILVSFVVNSIAIVPFINFLYRRKFVRKVALVGEGDKKVSTAMLEIEKRHDLKAGTPIGGGIIGLAVTVTLYLLFVFLLKWATPVDAVYSFMDEVHILVLAFLGFGALGFLDDWTKIFGKPRIGMVGAVFGVSGRIKFILQWAVGLVVATLLYFNLGLDFIHVPLTSIVIHLGVLFIPFAAFVVVSFSNAINVTDGLDGLSVGLLLIALLAFMLVAFSALDMPVAIFLAVWVGALIAFLYFNVYPARIWLGDTGALAFGAMLGLVGLMTGKVFALVFIGGIFVVEIISSFSQMASLKFFKKKIFPIAPLHHAFETIGWPEPKIVMRAWLAGIVLAIVGLWLALG